MIILIHILIAFSSIAIATLTLFRPSKKVFYASYVGVLLTLISGVYLVTMSPAQIVHVCISGLLYLALVTTVTVFARVKFVKLIQSTVSVE